MPEEDAVKVAHIETVIVAEIVAVVDTVVDEEEVELANVDCVVEIVAEGVVERVPD